MQSGSRKDKWLLLIQTVAEDRGFSERDFKKFAQYYYSHDGFEDQILRSADEYIVSDSRCWVFADRLRIFAGLLNNLDPAMFADDEEWAKEFREHAKNLPHFVWQVASDRLKRCPFCQPVLPPAAQQRHSGECGTSSRESPPSQHSQPTAHSPRPRAAEQIQNRSSRASTSRRSGREHKLQDAKPGVKHGQSDRVDLGRLNLTG